MRILPTSGGEILYKGQKINGKISRQLDQQVIKEIRPGMTELQMVAWPSAWSTKMALSTRPADVCVLRGLHAPCHLPFQLSQV